MEGKSAMDVIRQRSSCRSFDGRPLRSHDRGRLAEALASLPAGPFGRAVRVALIAAEGDAYRRQLRALGTYGVVSGARAFMVGAVAAGPMDMEDFGYVFEAAVLAATGLGLNTCWLGASFNRSSFARAIRLRGEEVLPAVSPVGYAAERMTVTDATTRYLARSARRKEWGELFFDGGWGRALSPEAAGVYAQALEAVRLAPSASNRQPWRIVKRPGQDAFDLFLRRTPFYNTKVINVPGGDLQRLDMGIAMRHFEVGAAAAGLTGRWAVEKDVDPFGTSPPRTSYIATWRREVSPR